jgi:hypothetical protein
MAAPKSPEEYPEDINLLREAIERKHGKSAEQLYEEREKRIRDAIRLQAPDRAPVVLASGYFPLYYAGLLPSAQYYEPVLHKKAVLKTLLDFEPDMYRGEGTGNGPLMEILDLKQTRWPGGTLPPHITHQFVESEYMKEDEYDLFLNDPSDFVLRYYLPRVYGALAPLTKLPPLRSFLGGPSLSAIASMFAAPEFRQLGEKLYQAGLQDENFKKIVGNFTEELAGLGFPSFTSPGGLGGAPFDTISDYLRGMRGSMLDMYRQPHQLLAACDKILQWRMAAAVPADPQKRGNPKRIVHPLHRGAEGFMSKKQFETFYWPGLKKVMLAEIDLGFVPVARFQGGFTSRLEYLLELPRGKAVAYFDQTDMFTAKEVLGNHLCIMGNVPTSLLQLASPQEVDDYCRKLIRVCGKDGGFILVNGGSLDQAKPANIKTMIDSVQKYKVA